MSGYRLAAHVLVSMSIRVDTAIGITLRTTVIMDIGTGRHTAPISMVTATTIGIGITIGIGMATTAITIDRTTIHGTDLITGVIAGNRCTAQAIGRLHARRQCGRSQSTSQPICGVNGGPVDRLADYRLRALSCLWSPSPGNGAGWSVTRQVIDHVLRRLANRIPPRQT